MKKQLLLAMVALQTLQVAGHDFLTLALLQLSDKVAQYCVLASLQSRDLDFLLDFFFTELLSEMLVKAEFSKFGDLSKSDREGSKMIPTKQKGWE